MNISVIKENKFWVIIGGVIVFMVGCYFYCTNSYRSETSKNVKDIDYALSRLEVYKRKGLKIINAKWVTAEKDKLETIKEKQLKYNELLGKRDVHIEKIFSTDRGNEIDDAALWKDMYVQRVDFLYNALSKSNVSASESALPFRKWGEGIPAWEEIVEEQKKFWIVAELLNIIQNKELKIDSLEAINFRKEGFLSNNASSGFYDIIPFTINVNMSIERILLLINELAKSKLLLEIETVNVNRELNNVVNVIIDAYAIDFKTEEVVDDSEEESA